MANEYIPFLSKIKEIVNYIDEHYAENLTLVEVAEHSA